MNKVNFHRIDGKLVRIKEKLAKHLVKAGKGEILADEPEVVVSESVKAEADALGVDLSSVEGSGKDGRILKRDLKTYQTKVLKAE